MQEVTGDIWKLAQPGSWIAIPTNGDLKRNGADVMGRGVALQARERFVGVDRRLGQLLAEYGNHVHDLGEWAGWRLFSFPTKHHWRDSANLALIVRSADELWALWVSAQQWPQVYLPWPGCGNGGLRREQVRPLLANVLTYDEFMLVGRARPIAGH